MNKKYIGYVAIALFFAIAGSVATQQYIESITCKDCILDNPTFVNYTFPNGSGSIPLNIVTYVDLGDNGGTGERTIGGIYYTGDNPIWVTVLLDNGIDITAVNYAQIRINGSTIIDNYDNDQVGASQAFSLKAIIPPHSSYQLVFKGNIELANWYEQNLTT
jgi:hypothetical protein